MTPPKRPAQDGPGLLDYASKMARTLVTGPRQIGHIALINRGAHTVHRQRWPHGLAAIVDRRSKHTTHIGSVPTGVSCTTTRSLSQAAQPACMHHTARTRQLSDGGVALVRSVPSRYTKTLPRALMERRFKDSLAERRQAPGRRTGVGLDSARAAIASAMADGASSEYICESISIARCGTQHTTFQSIAHGGSPVSGLRLRVPSDQPRSSLPPSSQPPS
jgi:hypothetical protein